MCPRFLSLLLIYIPLLVACTSDNDTATPPEEELPQGIPYQRITVTEVQQSDAEPVTLTCTFDFNEGRLYQYKNNQSIQIAGEEWNMEENYTISYPNGAPHVEDAYGNIADYVPGSNGYVASCTRKSIGGEIRHDTFTYHTIDGHTYLAGIRETLQDGTLHATLRIEYDTPHCVRITQQIGDFTQTYLAATASMHPQQEPPCVPSLFLSELYPLSSHLCALYGWWIGVPFAEELVNVTIQGGEERAETVSYTYRYDEEGMLIDCTADNPYSSFGKRTITYSFVP